MVNYTKKALTNVGIIFFISIVAAFLGFFVRILFARNLSVEEFGLFYAIIAFISFWGILKSLGLDYALVYFIPKFKAKLEFKNIKNSIIYVVRKLLIYNIIFLIIVLFFAKYLGVNFFRHDFAPLVLILMAISFFIDSFVLIAKSSFQGLQRMLLFSSVDIIRMTLIIAISFVLFKMNYGLWSPVIAYIITPIILFFIYIPLLYFKNKKIFSESKFFRDNPLFTKIKKYGLQIVLIHSIGLVILYSDRIMLTFFKTLEDVGIYSAVFPIAMLLWYFSDAITKVLLPMTSELHSKGLKEELKKGIELLYRYAFIVIVPVSFLIFSFSKTILDMFYGINYISGSLTLKVLAIGVILLSFHKINVAIFYGMGKPKTNAYIVTIGAIINIILNFVLIPLHGFLGAAIATLLSFLLMALFSFYLLVKERIVVIPYWRWAKTLVSSLIFLWIVNYLNMNLGMNLFVKIPVILLISGAVYTILLFVLKLVTFAEIRELFKRLKTV